MEPIALNTHASESSADAQTDSSAHRLVSSPTTGRSRAAAESLFVASLGTIDAIVLSLARRRRLSADDTADLASMVRLRMIDDDYAILRKFQGRSSLKTYLTVVVYRLFLDERIARLGKWRPSSRARREGPTGVLFERLTTRDGLTFDEACAALETNHHIPIERTTLEGLYSRVRRSPLRRFVAIDQGLEEIPSGLDSPEEGLAGVERTYLAKRARTALARAVATLKPQDRRILQLRFCRGASIADIARTTGLKQKALYGRFERLLKTLRSHLEHSGIAGRDILDVIGRTEVIER